MQQNKWDYLSKWCLCFWLRYQANKYYFPLIYYHKPLSLFIASVCKKHGREKLKRRSGFEFGQRQMARESDQRQRGNAAEEEGIWAGGPLCLCSPPALPCQTHSCLTKQFFTVKFQCDNVTAEDSARSTRFSVDCLMDSDCRGFPLPVICISDFCQCAVRFKYGSSVSRSVCQWCCRARGRMASLCIGIILHTHVSSRPKQQPTALFRLV